MTRTFISIFIISLALLSCTNKKRKVNRYTTSTEFMNNLLEKNEDEIQRFFEEIYVINDVNNFINDTLPSYKVITSTDIENKTFSFKESVEKVFDSDHIIFFEDLLILSSKGNIDNNSDFFRNVADYKFGLSYLRPNLKVSDNLSRSVKISFLDNINPSPENILPSKYDSIDKLYADKKTKNFLNELSILKKAKYLVYFEDEIFMQPKLISDTLFNSGLLYSKMNVFHLQSKKKIAEKTIIVLNSNSISNFKSLKNLDLLLLNLDLLKQRELEVINFLNIKESIEQ